MKLGELLLLRADLQKRLQSLKERTTACVIVQEGDKPAEDPQVLLTEADQVEQELEALIARINKANTAARLSDGKSLTEALAARDVLKLRHARLKAAVEGTRKPPQRYGTAEIRWVPTVDPAGLQHEVDTTARKLRELNTQIQAANWEIEV